MNLWVYFERILIELFALVVGISCSDDGVIVDIKREINTQQLNNATVCAIKICGKSKPICMLNENIYKL